MSSSHAYHQGHHLTLRVAVRASIDFQTVHFTNAQPKFVFGTNKSGNGVGDDKTEGLVDLGARSGNIGLVLNISLDFLYPS